MTLERRTPLKRTPTKRTRKVNAKDFPAHVKDEIRRRSRGQCEFPDCLKHAQHFHHRLMRSHGGQGVAENGLHVCFFHHAFIHANHTLSYEAGWLIRSSTPDAG
jgi:hypothetical protein